jgi:hypothetical protein
MMTKDEEVIKMFAPKGGMCANCKNVSNDCSTLDFSTMPTIETNYISQSNTLIHRVRCSNFLRRKRT